MKRTSSFDGLGILGTIKQQFVNSRYRAESVGFSLILFSGIFFLVYAWRQPWAYRRTGDGLGLAVFPSIFLAGLIIYSIVCLIGVYRVVRADSMREEDPGPVSRKGDEDIVWLPAIFLAGLAFLAAFFLSHIDPLILVAILGLAILLVGRIRAWYLLAGTTFGLALFIYVFIVRLAGIFFPTAWFF